jgi:hypothetical protein
MKSPAREQLLELQDSDWLSFFRDIYLGFGPPEALVLRCVRRAYRDFNRTWHGAKDPTAQREQRRSAGLATIVEAVRTLQRRRIGTRAFDIWHSDTMAALMRATDPEGKGTGLTLGQAQKWINMSLKYAVGSREPGLHWVEPVAHVPIDRILLAQLGREPRFQPAVECLPDGAWSKLEDEAAYLAFQRKLRQATAPSYPLALEFQLWLAAQRMAGSPH